jgi:hypothetical protein
MTTEVIDKLVLELSLITHANTAMEIALQAQNLKLQEALVYVAFAGHHTEKHMLPPKIVLGGNDTVEVKLSNGEIVTAYHPFKK